MNAPAHVVYYGPDAAAVEQRWHEGDRPFDLSGYEDDAAVVAEIDDGRVDALACTGPDVLPLVADVRDVAGYLPIVVLGRADIDAATALERGVTHHVQQGDDAVVDCIEGLEAVVSRYRRERRERTMLDSLLENIPLSVYFKDRKSRHVKVSEDMTTLMGQPYIESPEGRRYHTPADVVGTTDFDLYPDELAEDAVEDDREILESEEPIQNRIEHAFGTPFDGTFVTTSKAPWYDENGDVVGTVGVTRDISERKQYEHKLERQNERLERFAQVVSHDLRNPLEVAHGRLAFAREDGDAEHFDAIERSLDRMDQLIDDVLAIARHGEAVDDPEAVDLATAARNAWVVVDSGDATLRIATDATVRADAGRLSQLFENLFRNAVEHGSTSPASQAQRDAVEHGSTSPRSASPHEDADEQSSSSPASQARQDAPQRDSTPAESSLTTEDSVECESGTGQRDERADEDDDSLTITVGDLPLRSGFYVADDGSGIPEDERESVFDAGYSTGEEGTGLGLNIVESIADAHGWSATVTESEAGGARFEFDDVWGSAE